MDSISTLNVLKKVNLTPCIGIEQLVQYPATNLPRYDTMLSESIMRIYKIKTLNLLKKVNLTQPQLD